LAFLGAQPQVDAGSLALVGASMGGSASIIVGADDPRVQTVVAISTSPDSAGQFPGAVVEQLSPRPFLALSCNEDPLTKIERVHDLYEHARSPKQLVILDCAVHANDILDTHAAKELQSTLLDWLSRHLTATP
jgi:dienelactone hydrolase